MSTYNAPPLPPCLNVTRWPDRTLETLGHSVDSDYVETYWLPVLGPSALLLLRRLGRMAATEGVVPVNVAALAASLGLSGAAGRHDVLGRAVHRLCRFDAAKLDDDTLRVRTHMGPVPLHLTTKWPVFLKVQHSAAIGTR